MVKTWIEVCLISGRGLRRTSSSLWKLQWYAVGWIRPDDKYCTKIDASGKPNPLWKTAFSAAIDFDPSQPNNAQDLALHVEVYSRDPIFLRESLLGSATVALKEFLDKYYSSASASASASDARKGVDEVGSFQLRKRNSNKPLGFVDVSIRISEEKEHYASLSFLGGEEGFNLDNLGGKPNQPETSYHVPIPSNYPASAAAPRALPPAPPPPSSNVGYVPNFFPMTSKYTPSSYINMPSTAACGAGPGFGIGAGIGALATGAVIFGDDVHVASRDVAATMSTYPPPF